MQMSVAIGPHDTVAHDLGRAVKRIHSRAGKSIGNVSFEAYPSGREFSGRTFVLGAMRDMVYVRAELSKVPCGTKRGQFRYRLTAEFCPTIGDIVREEIGAFVDQNPCDSVQFRCAKKAG